MRTRSGTNSAPSGTDDVDGPDDNASSPGGNPMDMGTPLGQDGSNTTVTGDGRNTTVPMTLDAGRNTTVPMTLDASGDAAPTTSLAEDVSFLKAQMESITLMFQQLIVSRASTTLDPGSNENGTPTDDVPIPKSAESPLAQSALTQLPKAHPITNGTQVPINNGDLNNDVPNNGTDPLYQSPFKSCRRNTTIDKFDPSSTLPARLWMQLFETELDGANDLKKIRFLATYLTKDGLRWFAQFIAPNRNVYSWAKAKELFLEKFAKDDVNPLVAAKNRVLLGTETIQSYFDDKSRLLELADIPVPGMIGLLTDGVPDSYRALLIARNPSTVSEWLYSAQLFESTKKQEKRTVNLAHVSRPGQRTSTTGPDEAPRKPCPRCLEQSGIHAYHWLRNCSLPRTQGNFPNKHAPSGHLNSNGGPSRA